MSVCELINAKVSIKFNIKSLDYQFEAANRWFRGELI